RFDVLPELGGGEGVEPRIDVEASRLLDDHARGGQLGNVGRRKVQPVHRVIDDQPGYAALACLGEQRPYLGNVQMPRGQDGVVFGNDVEDFEDAVEQIAV